jgi:hypothetical protein
MMRRAFGVVAVLLVCIFLGAAARAEHDPRIGPFHNVVLFPNSAVPVWRWLDRETRPNDPYVDAQSRFFFARPSTRVTSQSDRFLNFTRGWMPPPGGTDFRFSVGSDRWSVRVDAQRHLVFYMESCCSYGRKVLATYVHAPPPRTAHADLSSVVPASGTRIGDSSRRVFALLGAPARRLTSPKSRRWAVAYSRPLKPHAKLGDRGSTCVQERTAVFAGDRLVAYEIYDGC